MNSQERKARLKHLIYLIDSGQFYSRSIPLQELFHLHDRPREEAPETSDKHQNYGYMNLSDIPSGDQGG